MAQKQRTDYLAVITGMMTLITGLIFYRSPTAPIAQLTVYLGIALIARTIYYIIRLYRTHFKNQHVKWLVKCGSLFNLTIGVIFIFLSHLENLPLTFFISLWFIIESLIHFAILSDVATEQTGFYWAIVVQTVMGTTLGLCLLIPSTREFITNSPFLGMYLIFNGLIYILIAFDSKLSL